MMRIKPLPVSAKIPFTFWVKVNHYVFHSHGQRCFVRDGAIWIDDPDDPAGRLTGAAASQLQAVRRLVQAGVLGVEEALCMGAETPARALGLDQELGRLIPGARADLIVLGAELELLEVLVGGNPVRGEGAEKAETGR